MSKHAFVFATRNSGKLSEVRAILGDRIEIRGLDEFLDVPEVIEDGETFEANAVKKAAVICRHLGLPTIADDSGLEVDALDGAPGVRSARFAGPNASDRARNEKVLRLLSRVPPEDRIARFRCVLAVAYPDGRVYTTEGSCEGLIAEDLRGDRGFGYDPVFLLPQLGKTFGEVCPEIKNMISHRAKALQGLRALVLEDFDRRRGVAQPG